MDKLRIGIVGVGGIANGKHMPSLAKLKSVEMVAFCDIIKERAVEGARKYGIPNATVYTDYRELIARTDIDIVHVLTPNKHHAAISIAALEAGKHVMCEKPMAINYAEAKAMVDAAKRTGKKLTIGYQNRFRPDTLYLKDYISDGGLGDIYYAKALAVRRRGVPTWGVFLDEEMQGGGPLIDIGTHALDLTLWLMDNYRWESVMGSSYKKLNQMENAANPWGPWDPKKFTVEDSAFGFIKFENGATIILESSWALNTLQVGAGRYRLCGTEGGADFDDGLRINGEKYSRLFTMKPELQSGGVDFYEGKSDSPPVLEAQRFIDSIVNNKPTFVLPEQAAVVTQILEAIYESARSGKAVYNPEL